MSKTYFGITRNKGNRTAIVGVVANNDLAGSRVATRSEVEAILSVVKNAATDSLADALRDGTYPNTVVVWDKRADARKAIEDLQSFASPYFDYSVGEFGETSRKVKPVIGWRIMFYDQVSAHNYPATQKDRDARVAVDHAELFGGDVDANWLFPTRAAGRAEMVSADLTTIRGYRLVPVYADA